MPDDLRCIVRGAPFNMDIRERLRTYPEFLFQLVQPMITGMQSFFGSSFMTGCH